MKNLKKEVDKIKDKILKLEKDIENNIVEKPKYFYIKNVLGIFLSLAIISFPFDILIYFLSVGLFSYSTLILVLIINLPIITLLSFGLSFETRTLNFFKKKFKIKEYLKYKSKVDALHALKANLDVINHLLDHHVTKIY